MKHLRPSLASLLLLSSCGGWAQWNIGERIRSGSTTYVGAISHDPGPVYVKKGDKKAPFYHLAPEVTYRMKPALVEWHGGQQADPYEARGTFDIQKTGRQVLVRLEDGYPVEVVESPPAGYVARYGSACDCGRTEFSDRELGNFPSERATQASLGARMAAAPFDYLIDPALSAVSTAGAYVGMAGVGLVTGIVLLPYLLINPDALP